MSSKEGVVGRKRFSFVEGVPILQSMTITENPHPDEDEEQFTQRLVQQYGRERGEIEVIIKNGRPDYAVITLEPGESTT
jgi:hypothetical protein